MWGVGYAELRMVSPSRFPPTFPVKSAAREGFTARQAAKDYEEGVFARNDALFGKLELFEALAELADRRRRIWEHSLKELLLAAICAVGSGAESWTSVSEWGQLKLCLSVL